MKVSIKKVMIVGAAVLAGGIVTGTIVQATAPVEDKKPAVEEKILHAFGDTLVMKKEPVDEMFSHKSHVIEYGLSCDSCHPDMFEKKRGAAMANGDYTMASLDDGMYCGACHDGDTAFSTTDAETCVTCHGSDMVQPETVVFTKPVKAVIFSHVDHTEMGLECSSCHNDLFKMKVGAAEEKPEGFTMQALYDGKFCGGCHNGEDAFASDTSCTTCHIGVKGYERMHGADSAKAGGH